VALYHCRKGGFFLRRDRGQEQTQSSSTFCHGGEFGDIFYTVLQQTCFGKGSNMSAKNLPRFGTLALCAGLVCLYAHAEDTSMQLAYDTPAEAWNAALPLGNGRLGAMVFGGVAKERIQLNEDSLWSGGPQDADNPEALEHLDEVRQFLKEGKYTQAEELTIKSMVCRGKGSGLGQGGYIDYGSYQTLGDLVFSFDKMPATPENYRRALDLDRAVASVSHTANGAQFRREMFASAPDQVLVLRFETDLSDGMSFNVLLDRDPLRSSRPGKNDSRIEPFTEHKEQEPAQQARPQGDDTLVLSARAWLGKGMRYEARLKILPESGTVRAANQALEVRGAKAVTLLLAAATDYRGNDPSVVCTQRIEAAAKKTYADLLAAHAAGYQSLFHRVRLDLGRSEAAPRPMIQRLKEAADGPSDPALAALYFQFGRYLLISSSRPGGLPANLQGLWCDHYNAPWNADYHHNINDQMNYWPAETTNLAECHEPFLKYIDSLRAPGRKTAQVHYGARGWVAHTISNVWGFTSPGEHPSWGQFTAAGAWLCQDLWEHYAFGGDLEYLRWAYPIMKESAQFYLDFLIEEPKHGWRVTAPSNSPENKFRAADGQEASVCMGPSMDMEILWDLFTNCIEASKALGEDEAFRATLETTRARLAPPQIGKHGQLQEWIEDFDETEPGHRHMSHLFALHPGHQITPQGTPELAQAARVSIERRLANGGGHSGWSRAWIVNFWARLGQGDSAEENLRALFARSTLPNLFDNHPPFQIDGNFGATAAIAEMLLQSHTGEVVLLPALPKAWPQGQVSRLRARGGYEIEIAWNAGAPVRAAVRATQKGTLRLRWPEASAPAQTEADGKPVMIESTAHGQLAIDLAAGQILTMSFQGADAPMLPKVR